MKKLISILLVFFPLFINATDFTSTLFDSDNSNLFSSDGNPNLEDGKKHYLMFNHDKKGEFTGSIKKELGLENLYYIQAPHSYTGPDYCYFIFQEMKKQNGWKWYDKYLNEIDVDKKNPIDYVPDSYGRMYVSPDSDIKTKFMKLPGFSGWL